MEISKNSDSYKKIVKIKDCDNYTILVSELPADTKIVCPFDSDMTVSKNEKNEIVLGKKSFSKEPMKKS